MKVLITGATGLVGTALTKRLRQAGIAVNYLTTDPGKVRDEAGYTGYVWNPHAGTMDPASLVGVRAIVNLAGASISQPWTSSNRVKIQESRTKSLNTLFRELEQHGRRDVEYLVSASAIGIYPHSFTEYHVESSGESGSGFLADTVRKWESAALDFESMGIDCGILRLGIVLAAHGGALPSILRPVRAYVGAPLGSGKQWQSWIHLEDAARVFEFALENQIDGVYNAVAPNPVTNEKLTRQVARVLGKPLWLPHVPAWALRAALGERSSLVLDSQRVCSDKIKMEGFDFQYANLQPALEDLLT